MGKILLFIIAVMLSNTIVASDVPALPSMDNYSSEEVKTKKSKSIWGKTKSMFGFGSDEQEQPKLTEAEKRQQDFDRKFPEIARAKKSSKTNIEDVPENVDEMMKDLQLPEDELEGARRKASKINKEMPKIPDFEKKAEKHIIKNNSTELPKLLKPDMQEGENESITPDEINKLPDLEKKITKDLKKKEHGIPSIFIPNDKNTPPALEIPQFAEPEIKKPSKKKKSDKKLSTDDSIGGGEKQKDNRIVVGRRKITMDGYRTITTFYKDGSESVEKYKLSEAELQALEDKHKANLKAFETDEKNAFQTNNNFVIKKVKSEKNYDLPELDAKHIEFIDKETRLLMLPNDDVVLGKLGEKGKMEAMNYYDYTKIFWENYNFIKREPRREMIDNFLRNYRSNFKHH